MNSLSLPSASGSVGKYAWATHHSTPSKSAGHYEPSPADFINSFYAVLQRWESETAFSSNPDEITKHPSYQALVQNAENVIELIISDLRRRPSFLVWVLDDAIGEQPYSDDEVGDIVAMTEGWIRWAERNKIAAHG